MEKISLEEMYQMYIKGKIEIYEAKSKNIKNIKNDNRNFFILSKKIMEESQAQLFFKSYNKDLFIKDRGILQYNNKYFYYIIEISRENLENLDREIAINTPVYLEKINNLNIIGEDIFEIKNGENFNILKLKTGFEEYFSETVENIQYIFLSESDRKNWNTLKYIILTIDGKNICYKNLDGELLKIELPQINFDKIIDISVDSQNLVVQDKDKVKLYFRDKEVLIADEFIQVRGKVYFFKKKNTNKIFDNFGKEIKKGFKVLSTLPNKVTERIIVLENTKSHKKAILIFSENFKKCSLIEEKIYILKEKVVVDYNDFTSKNKIKILNLEGKSIVLKNVEPKAPRLLEVEPLHNNELNVNLIIIPVLEERGTFYYKEDCNKTFYSNMFLVNIKEIGFKKFYLIPPKDISFDITKVDEDELEKEIEKKNRYYNKKIKKVFLEKSERGIYGINLFFCFIYEIEFWEKKLKKYYETFRVKLFYEQNIKENNFEEIDRTEYQESQSKKKALLIFEGKTDELEIEVERENEYYNLIQNREDLEKIKKLSYEEIEIISNLQDQSPNKNKVSSICKNELPEKVLEYLDKIIK